MVKAVTPDKDNADITEGFAIAKSVAATLVKYLPQRLFAISKTGSFVLKADPEDTPVDGVMFQVKENGTTSHEIELDLGTYGTARFFLKVRLKFHITMGRNRYSHF